ncbi:hypothetical protein FY152_04320 [Agrobacterium tumefaciens]|nr:hypothetical protein FY152_04320 [Agrobacterium tumefaciens]
MAPVPPFKNQGFGSWLNNNGDALLQSGLGLLSGKTGTEQAALGAKGFSDARKLNRTVEFLKTANPELAQAVESGMLSGGDAFKLHYAADMEAKKPKSNLMAVGKRLYDANTRQWIEPPGGVGGADDAEYGLAPVYGTDAQGRTVLGQLSKNGTFQQTKLPDGFTPTPGTSNIDTGTGTLTINNRTGARISETPKNLADAEREKLSGKSRGEAAGQLGSARQTAAMVAKQVNDLKTDPYLPNMLGSVPNTGGLLLRSDMPNRSPESNRVQGKINQLQGGAFLQARQLLQGGGQITDFEGKKAEDAYVRLNTAQNEKDFKIALDDFNDAVSEGVRKLEAQASGNEYVPSSGAATVDTGRTTSGTKWRVK